MKPLVLERILPAPCEQVFRFVTERDKLLLWWGPECMTLPEDSLDFTKLGPWHSVMMNEEGQHHKVSGQVTRIEPPHLVAFTWGWHDEEGKRGAESHVMLEVMALDGGRTHLRLTHTDLADADIQNLHEQGWTSSLRKLERHVCAMPVQ